jgi:hypothetical protein
MGLERGEQHLLRRRIERIERLVEQPERRLRGGDAGKGGAPALAGGEGAHRAGRQRGEIEGGERCVSVAGNTTQAIGDVDILAHREVALQPVEVTEPGNLATPPIGVGPHVLALPMDRARLGRHQERERAQQRGLARAVAAGERQQAA